MKFFPVFLIFILVVPFDMFPQNDSIAVCSAPKVSFLKKQAVPLGLLAAGVLLNIGTIKYDIQDKIPDTENRIDDYLQYIPMAQMYLYDFMGLEHQNSVFDQTKYLLIAQLTSGIIVHTIKPLSKVRRPKGAEKSFPSGHTALTFVGATVLFYEFRESSPWLAYSGFICASATGWLRMTNNYHWLPDVLVGAGIGIFSATLVYHFEPLKNWHPFKKKDLTITPSLTPKSLALQITF